MASGPNRAAFLVQGTLYPDVIESVAVRGPSQTIKTHHNVGGLPKDLPFALIEPLRELFKDEVRSIGRELGLPEEMLTKHPFPGPGLAVRLLGEVTEERLALLREADAIVVEEIRRAGLYEKVWQAFAVLLPVRSVGVMGDERSYGFTVAVRVVESEDAMTADWTRLPMEVLERISTRIVNEVSGINRVVYDISSKPPSTIEWEVKASRKDFNTEGTEGTEKSGRSEFEGSGKGGECATLKQRVWREIWLWPGWGRLGSIEATRGEPGPMSLYGGGSRPE